MACELLFIDHIRDFVVLLPFQGQSCLQLFLYFDQRRLNLKAGVDVSLLSFEEHLAGRRAELADVLFAHRVYSAIDSLLVHDKGRRLHQLYFVDEPLVLQQLGIDKAAVHREPVDVLGCPIDKVARHVGKHLIVQNGLVAHLAVTEDVRTHADLKV